MEREEKQKILIADDSEMNRALLIEMLQDDFDILEVENGEEAVAVLQENAAEISLLLLDIVMPKMDGFEVLAYMNKCHWIEDIPVIMISSENASSYIERAYDFGVTDYISRPFDVAVVRRRVSNTMLLSERQRRMVDIATEQIYEKEKNSRLMISILSHIVEFRNGESGLHVVHINIITGLLLKRLVQKTDMYALTSEEIAMITNASALHDIGKITVPDGILNKPGRLTAEEFEIMKGHALAGARMLEELPEQQKNESLVRTAYQICRWHHERYDGGGYPDGLKGEEIPISAQVVALADVYDALTSERCYKKAFSHEKAMEMILAGQCGVFSPLLLECLKDIEKTLKQEVAVRSNSYDETGDITDMASQMRENKLFTSERLLRQLECERQRFRFMTLTSSQMVFVFTLSPPLLSLNKVAAYQLGVEEVQMEPVKNGFLDRYLDRKLQETLREKLRKTTAEEPSVQMEVQLRIHSEVRWYQCDLCTIWASAKDKKYAGVIGKLTDIDQEHRQAGAMQDAAFQYAMKFSESRKRGFPVGKGYSMTGREAWMLIQCLQMAFDSVRLVDAAVNTQISVSSSGKLEELPYQCYAVWNREKRCEHCISAKCFYQKSRMEKFEFVEDDVYHVLAIYVEVDGRPYSMEMINRITDETLLGAYGKKEWVDSIFEHNKKLYIDPVSGMHNRRYYDEQISELRGIQAVAMMDVDNFKRVNDSYGHQTGDVALKLIATAICSRIRSTDTVVRYGGDEFVVVFRSIPQVIFEEKLVRIREQVENLELEGCPELHFSISIGGVYGCGRACELLQEADALMYQAKKQKNGLCIAVNTPGEENES